MDHIKIIKRAFHLTLNFRALWVFGIILALVTSGSSGSSGSGNNGVRFSDGNGSGDFPWPGQGMPEMPQEVVNTIIAVIVGLCCFLLVLSIVTAIAYYVSEVSLIRMVDQNESTGEKATVKQGFRMGWSRAAWRLFLIDLVIALASWIAIVLLMIVAALPLLVWFTDSVPLQILGTVTTIGLAVLFITVLIVIGIALSLLSQFFHRASALENLGVIASIRRGFEVVRQRLGDVIIMALILFGLGLVWFFVMIPVFLLLLVVGTILAGLPALLVGMLVNLFIAQGAVPWIVAAVIGLPIFILIFGAPSLFLGGLAEVFKSSTWTLTYREAVALEAIKAEVSPEPSDEASQPEDETPAEA